jgi:hypothetical protein
MKKENAQLRAQSIPMQTQYNTETVLFHAHVRQQQALKLITAFQ